MFESDFNSKMKKAISAELPKKEAIRSAVKNGSKVSVANTAPKRTSAIGSILTACFIVVFTFGFIFIAPLMKKEKPGLSMGSTDRGSNILYPPEESYGIDLESGVFDSEDVLYGQELYEPDPNDVSIRLTWEKELDRQMLKQFYEEAVSNGCTIPESEDIESFEEYLLKKTQFPTEWEEGVTAKPKLGQIFRLPDGNGDYKGYFYEWCYEVTLQNGVKNYELRMLNYYDINSHSISIVFEANNIYNIEYFSELSIWLKNPIYYVKYERPIIMLWGAPNVTAESGDDTLAYEMKFLGYLDYDYVNVSWTLGYKSAGSETSPPDSVDDTNPSETTYGSETSPVDMTSEVETFPVDTGLDTEEPVEPPIAYPLPDVDVESPIKHLYTPIDDFGSDAMGYFDDKCDGVPIIPPGENITIRETVKFPAYYYQDGLKMSGAIFLSIGYDQNAVGASATKTFMALYGDGVGVIAAHRWDGLCGIFVDSDMPDRFVVATVQGGEDSDTTFDYAVYYISDMLTKKLEFVIRPDEKSYSLEMLSPYEEITAELLERVNDETQKNKLIGNELMEMLEESEHYMIAASFNLTLLASEDARAFMPEQKVKVFEVENYCNAKQMIMWFE